MKVLDLPGLAEFKRLIYSDLKPLIDRKVSISGDTMEGPLQCPEFRGVLVGHADSATVADRLSDDISIYLGESSVNIGRITSVGVNFDDDFAFKKQDVDLRAYPQWRQDIYYPVVFKNFREGRISRFIVSENQSKSSNPAWVTSSDGAYFHLHLELTNDPSGYNFTTVKNCVHRYTRNNVSPFGGILRVEGTRDFVIWLRGGYLYKVLSETGEYVGVYREYTPAVGPKVLKRTESEITSILEDATGFDKSWCRARSAFGELTAISLDLKDKLTAASVHLGPNSVGSLLTLKSSLRAASFYFKNKTFLIGTTSSAFQTLSSAEEAISISETNEVTLRGCFKAKESGFLAKVNNNGIILNITSSSWTLYSIFGSSTPILSAGSDTRRGYFEHLSLSSFELAAGNSLQLTKGSKEIFLATDSGLKATAYNLAGNLNQVFDNKGVTLQLDNVVKGICPFLVAVITFIRWPNDQFLEVYNPAGITWVKEASQVRIILSSNMVYSQGLNRLMVIATAVNSQQPVFVQNNVTNAIIGGPNGLAPFTAYVLVFK